MTANISKRRERTPRQSKPASADVTIQIDERDGQHVLVVKEISSPDQPTAAQQVIALSGTKVLSNDLTARGYPGINTVIAACAMIVTVVGDVLLIPRYRILGAAVASSIGYTASFGLTLLAFRARSGVRLPFLPRFPSSAVIDTNGVG